MKYPALVLALGLIAVPPYAFAEKTPVYEVEPVTSTANRTVASGDETGTLQVITREEIRSGNYKSVSEVLQNIPGVYFATESFLGNRATEANTGPKIRIRGQGAKLLIDGRPMNMAIFGCLPNNMLTLDHVDRIEITKGSESVLYGSDGLGGVINIITRNPQDFGFGLNVRGGTNGTLISSLEHENIIGKFGYYISGSLKRSEGYRGDADYSDDSGFLKLTYDINQSLKLESSLNMYNGRWDDPGTVYNPRKEFWSDFKRRHADVTLKKWTGSGRYTLKAYHNEGHHVFTRQDGWESRDHTNGFRADMVRIFAEGANRLTVGADGRWYAGEALVDDDVYNGSGFKFWLNNKKWYDENETAVFLSDRQILLDNRLVVMGGARVVRNSGFGTFFCPKVGTTLHGADLNVHFGYNRAFKSPSLLQTSLHKKSNPKLKPETADHFELGADYDIMESLKVGGTVFYIDGKDKPGMKVENGRPVRFENIGAWKHKGGELTLSYVHSRRFSFNAGYTYMDVGSNTQYNPMHQGTLSVHTSWRVLKRELNVNLNGYGVSKIYAGNDRENRLGDYVVLNLYSSMKVGRHAAVLFGVDNLLDKEYEAVYGYPFPGRVFTAGVRVEY